MIDIFQKYQTHAGERVDHLTILDPASTWYPVRGEVGGVTMSWTLSGKYKCDYNSDQDLVLVQCPIRKVFGKPCDKMPIEVCEPGSVMIDFKGWKVEEARKLASMIMEAAAYSQKWEEEL